MKNFKQLSILNLLAFLFHLIISVLSNIKGILSDKTVADISHKYETIFAPAGITFSIWGLIYISLSGLCIYHLKSAFTKLTTHPANVDTLSIGWLFIINNLATGLWLIAWINDRIIFSVILIVIQLLTLLLINLKVGILNVHSSFTQKLLTQFPLSIYFAWICIATIANTSAYLVSIGYQSIGDSAISLTIAMIIIAASITVFTINNRRNIFFGLVVIWAFYGIILKNQNLDPLTYSSVLKTLWFSIGIVGATTVIQYFKNERWRKTIPR